MNSTGVDFRIEHFSYERDRNMYKNFNIKHFVNQSNRIQWLEIYIKQKISFTSKIIYSKIQCVERFFDVEKALDDMDGAEIMGKRVEVSKSTNVSLLFKLLCFPITSYLFVTVF